MNKVYVVTLHNKEDLEQFYADMEEKGIALSLKRPLSRNTHYMMTEWQASEVEDDPRVWGVEPLDAFKIKRQAVNRQRYPISGNFWKDSQASTVSQNDLQWGHIHCAGNSAQRGKGQFGSINGGGTYEQVTDTVEVFNNARHVDVVIVDDPVSYDSGEWESPTDGRNRFVEYQWFNDLNATVGSIDDDGQSLPTGTITYGTNAATPQYHGIHVTGTACGQHYGWAKEANIYNIAVTDSWSSGQQVGPLLIFDYLRAFHQNKPINPDTGKKNPTITNHSYGGIFEKDGGGPVVFADVTQIQWRGAIYNSSNPGPSGWTEAGIEADFGFRFGLTSYPAWSSAVAADVQDAIADGVVIIGAAGNDNLLVAEVDDQDWFNIVTITGIGTIAYNRGAWPNTPDSGAINVGALSKQSDFRRSTYTMFGPGVDVFAPGDNILSAYGNSGGLADGKYAAGNFFNAIQGTSMASPQVCGVIACLATGKDRFTQADAFGYLDTHSIYNDMTFDLAGGGLDDNTCRQGSPNKYLHAISPRPEVGYLLEQKGSRGVGLTYPRVSTFNAPAPSAAAKTFAFNVTNSGASHYILNGQDRLTSHVDAQDPEININAGDTLEFTLNASGHPFYLKDRSTTGTGDQVATGTVTGNGTAVGTVTWDTTGVVPGTYYYICQFHSGMVGTIIIS